METKILVLSFLDSDGDIYKLNINNPASALEKSFVTGKMNAIIDSTAIVTPQGKTLTDVSNAYNHYTTLQIKLQQKSTHLQ